MHWWHLKPASIDLLQPCPFPLTLSLTFSRSLRPLSESDINKTMEKYTVTFALLFCLKIQLWDSLAYRGQWHGGPPFKQQGQGQQRSSVQCEPNRLPRAHILWKVNWDQQTGAKGKFLASNGEIVYLFLWIPLNSMGEFPARLQPLYWKYLLTTPQPSKHSKTGKRRTLAADQQDTFTVEDSICYLETLSLSSRMFGNPGRQHIPFIKEKASFHKSQVWNLPVCE